MIELHEEGNIKLQQLLVHHSTYTDLTRSLARQSIELWFMRKWNM